MPQRPATACVSTPGDRVGVQAVDGVLQSATAVLASRMAPDAGLSPRERGNHHPVVPDAALAVYAVYPRASGGTHDRGIRSGPWAGLSPRERGNHGRQ